MKKKFTQKLDNTQDNEFYFVSKSKFFPALGLARTQTKSTMHKKFHNKIINQFWIVLYSIAPSFFRLTLILISLVLRFSSSSMGSVSLIVILLFVFHV